jgi:hypothetical protein
MPTDSECSRFAVAADEGLKRLVFRLGAKKPWQIWLGASTPLRRFWVSVIRGFLPS